MVKSFSASTIVHLALWVATSSMLSPEGLTINDEPPREALAQYVRMAVGGTLHPDHVGDKVVAVGKRTLQNEGASANRLFKDDYLKNEGLEERISHIFFDDLLRLTAESDRAGSLVLARDVRSAIDDGLIEYDVVADKAEFLRTRNEERANTIRRLLQRRVAIQKLIGDLRDRKREGQKAGHHALSRP